MLVFCQGNKKFIGELNRIIRDMGLFIGLSVNMEKSKIIFSKRSTNKEELAAIHGCSIGYLPITYLGPPLAINYVRRTNFTSY